MRSLPARIRDDSFENASEFAGVDRHGHQNVVPAFSIGLFLDRPAISGPDAYLRQVVRIQPRLGILRVSQQNDVFEVDLVTGGATLNRVDQFRTVIFRKAEGAPFRRCLGPRDKIRIKFFKRSEGLFISKETVVSIKIHWPSALPISTPRSGP
jgi:hypothetical protein